MRALFISDLHLSADCPRSLAALTAFLAGPARAADALYILGDLFEYWAGDDDADEPVAAAVASALATCAAAGTRLYFMAGNRDFLLGEAYAARAHLGLLADPTLLDCDGRRLLLSHGDALCTDDEDYQRYRLLVRDPAWQAAFLARPLAERKAFIADLRARSRHEKTTKTMSIMDVNADAVAALLRAHDYPVLIHGHTHRPATHRFQLDGQTCCRHVLHNWDCRAGYLSCADGIISTHDFDYGQSG